MVYGQTKLDGERAVRAEHVQHYIVRAGWMFGGDQKDHKFVSKIAAQLRAGADEIYAVDDKWGTVTYTQDFAANLDALIHSGRYGTYHMVCEGGCTRYDVACEIVAVFGKPDVQVHRVSSDHFSDDYFAPRPRSEMMVNRALKEAGLNRMRPWKKALLDYLQTTERVGTMARRSHD
jgi:dTDP-4-dehydrorhamnose reductase